MATKFGRENGEYAKTVYDSGDACHTYLHDAPGQDKKKFSPPSHDVKDYSGMAGTKQKLKQSINKPVDSGEGMASQKNEGGSTTRNMKPKAPKASGNKAKAPIRGDM